MDAIDFVSFPYKVRIKMIFFSYHKHKQCNKKLHNSVHQELGDPEKQCLARRCQAIIWTTAGILLIGPLGTNFKEILIQIDLFSFNKMHLKLLSGNWQPCCLSLNVLIETTSNLTYSFIRGIQIIIVCDAVITLFQQHMKKNISLAR